MECYCRERYLCVTCGFKTNEDIEEETKMTNTDELKQSKDLKIGFFWEPKKKEIKEGMLVRFKSSVIKGKTFLGVVDHFGRGFTYVRYSEASKHPIAITEERITDAWEIVTHEPKEQNISAAQELSAQQESANFAHVAVQGIMAANEAKNCPCVSPIPPFKQKPIYTGNDMKKYGEEQYLRGREDEHRENPQGLKTVEEYKKYGRDCYLQGQTDEINRGTSLTFSDFDSSVARTWKKQDFKDAVSNAALGLTGEAGEVADLIKKAIYHKRGFLEVHTLLPEEEERALSIQDVKDELSDVLFYVSAMAQEFGFTLEDVAKHNREKLEKRFPEGFSTEASAQKKDKAPELKTDGEILIGYSKFWDEDTLKYLNVDKAPFGKTFFLTDHKLKKTLKELRDGNRVTIEDKHRGEFTFTKVGELVRIQFKDLEKVLDNHTCLVKVSYEEVTN